MSTSEYPEVYDFTAEGKSTLEGKLKSINAVTAKKYGSDEMVEKFVANIEDGEGTVWAIWLDSAVLNRAFRDEAKNRKAIGQRFAEDEEVTIEFLGIRQGATYAYKDFSVTFQYAAPSVDSFDALAGSVSAPADEPTYDPEPLPPVEVEVADTATTTPASDDIPF
jgi:hypothetical protein